MNLANNQELLSQEWQELHETLHEIQEMAHESESEYESELEGYDRPQPTTMRLRQARIITPTVIIRITLAPMSGNQPSTIFKNPTQIAGATSHTVMNTPVYNQPYIPIRTTDTNTGRTSGSGIVYVPKRGSNTLKVATVARPGVHSLRQATNWVTKQVKQSPALAQRITGVKILSNSKPCGTCAQKALAKVAKVVPHASNNLKIRFAPTATNTTTATKATKLRTTPLQHTTATTTTTKRKPSIAPIQTPHAPSATPKMKAAVTPKSAVNGTKATTSPKSTSILGQVMKELAI